jgi:hypothetical protein
MKDLKGWIHREFHKFTHLHVPTNPITARRVPAIIHSERKTRTHSWHNDSFKSGYRMRGKCGSKTTHE